MKQWIGLAVAILVGLVAGIALGTNLLAPPSGSPRANGPEPTAGDHNTNGVARTASSPYTNSLDYGGPATPQSIVPSNLDVQIHKRDAGDGMGPTTADHGADCSAPPATHQIDTLAQGVFACKNHLMTTIVDAGYGEIALTPDHMADWSGGAVTIKVDVSAHQNNGSDWVEVYVSPFAENSTLPCEAICPDFAGNPKDGLKFSLTHSALFATSPGDVERIDNFDSTQLPRTSEQQTLTSLGLNSAAIRTTYEIDISSGHVRFGLPGYNVWWTDTNIPPLSFTQGVVQITQHSYNPVKHTPDSLGSIPYDTWHWSHFSISNAVPFTIINGNKRSVNDASATTVEFPAPSPTGSFLRFSGFGTTDVSYDGGRTWTTQKLQTYCGCSGDPTGDFRTNWTPMPAGITSIMFRGTNLRGPWWVRDPAIWSFTTSP
jgi:hypothetical protein